MSVCRPKPGDIIQRPSYPGYKYVMLQHLKEEERDGRRDYSFYTKKISETWFDFSYFEIVE